MRVWHSHAWWHPIGFTLAVLATTAIVVAVTENSDSGGDRDNMDKGAEYFYDRGTFYKKEGDGYVVVKAPIGTVVPSLPEGYEEKQKGDITHYVFNGVWYEPVTSGDDVSYVVTTLQDGADPRRIAMKDLREFNRALVESRSLSQFRTETVRSAADHTEGHSSGRTELTALVVDHRAVKDPQRLVEDRAGSSALILDALGRRVRIQDRSVMQIGHDSLRE